MCCKGRRGAIEWTRVAATLRRETHRKHGAESRFFTRFSTEAQTQVDYGTRLENLLGASARLASANLEAFHRLNWSEAELAVLDAQRRFVREIPELPGGYYTSRCIDNAFRAVVYQYKNERVELEKANDTINRELQRKREELS